MYRYFLFVLPSFNIIVLCCIIALLLLDIVAVIKKTMFDITRWSLPAINSHYTSKYESAQQPLLCMTDQYIFNENGQPMTFNSALPKH